MSPLTRGDADRAVAWRELSKRYTARDFTAKLKLRNAANALCSPRSLSRNDERSEARKWHEGRASRRCSQWSAPAADSAPASRPGICPRPRICRSFGPASRRPRRFAICFISCWDHRRHLRAGRRHADLCRVRYRRRQGRGRARAGPGLWQPAVGGRLDGRAVVDRVRAVSGRRAQRGRSAGRETTMPPALRVQVDRASVVVGDRLPWRNARAAAFHTANELHVPTGADGAATQIEIELLVGRRHPQLLGAAAGRQDRPDPRPHESHVVHGRRAGNVFRPMRRILRHATCQHEDSRRR